MKRAGHGGRHPLLLPALIAGATAVGLVAGLLGEGWWDDLAAVGLAAPPVFAEIGTVASWCSARR